MNDILLPITIEKGVSFILPITWKDVEGVKKTIAGYSAALVFRASLDAPEAIVEFDESDGVTLSDEGLYNVTINISGEQTDAMPVLSSGVWALKMTKDGVSENLLNGPFEVKQYAAR